MMVRRSVGALLTLMLLCGTLPAASMLAATPEPDPYAPAGDLEDAKGFMYMSKALLSEPEGPPAPALDLLKYRGSTPTEKMLNAAKAAQRDLDRSCARARRKFSGADQACELSVVNKACKAQAQIVGSRVDLLRKLHSGGDQRKFFTRLGSRVSRDLRTAWYRIGPLGRRIFRPIGDEIKKAVLSGSIPQAGVLRQFIKRSVVRGLRREAGRIVDERIDRAIRGPGNDGKGVCADKDKAVPVKVDLEKGTGVLEVSGVYKNPDAGASMVWDHFLGVPVAGELLGCTVYQTYNPQFGKPERPGLKARLSLDLDGGKLGGIISGDTYYEEWNDKATGDFRLAIHRGKITRQADGSGLDLSGRGVVALGYWMDSWCVVPDGGGTKTVPREKVGSGGGTVTIDGRIDLVGDTYLLSLLATHQNGEQEFRTNLFEVPIGKWTPPPAASPASGGSDGAAPWDE